MKKRKNKNDLRALCAEVHEDDGVDPRIIKRRRQSSEDRNQNRKTLQLCKQVSRALSMTLAGDCGDAMLREVEIVRVEPAPNSGRLAVVVRLGLTTEAQTHRAALQRLQLAESFLRSQIAASITRKHVPELVFRWCDEREAVP